MKTTSATQKDFTCRPWTSNSSAWADTLASCSRNPQQTKYAIAFYKDGRLLCRFYNTEGENICKSVATGGKQTIGGVASYVL
ncbi:hypothetical protein [Elusimicrobium minutum]|uniref:hypothetical protein n=1 Tax=Elusimicrobium minutum TaxID=423605 RepID=UPI0011D14FC1|nr:hypothetical protein [Elusimicrobium minutum]